MRNKFIIVGAPRTGSTLLVRTLHEIDGICCHGELLADKVRGYQDGFNPMEADKKARDARIATLCEARDKDCAGFIMHALETGKTAGGFKALYTSLLDARWRAASDALAALPGLKLIHLLRKNTLRRYVSEQIMRSGGANHSAAGGKSEVRMKVHIEIAKFQRVTAETGSQREAVLARFGHLDTVQLTYEQLALDPGAAVKSVCQFLEIDNPPRNIEPALKKVGATDLRETVHNYEELLAHPATRELVLMD